MIYHNSSFRIRTFHLMSILSLFFLWTSKLEAQEKRRFVGGALNIGYSEQSSSGSPSLRSLSIGLSPEIGFYLKSSWLVSGSVQVGYSRVQYLKNSLKNYHINQASYGIGCQSRYLFFKGRIKPYVSIDGNASVAHLDYINDNESGSVGIVGQNQKYLVINAGTGLGIWCDLNEYLVLTVQLGTIGYRLYYDKNLINSDNPNLTHFFGVKLGLNQLNSFGLYYKF